MAAASPARMDWAGARLVMSAAAQVGRTSTSRISATSAGDAADHALTEAGVEAAAEEHQVRRARRLHRDDLERTGRGRSARRERRGGDEREEAGLEETTEHRNKRGGKT
jgi:hypothetical protein